ncbi:MAG: hypothetical protein GXO55_01435 [Chloroflexi bacterium]|nr:hypothetical protein [Chloroflexota bacterium]
MPIYEYRCLTCGRRFSVFYRTYSGAGTQATCPHCGGNDVQRLISRVHVRGSGGSQEEVEETSRSEGTVFGRKELEAARRQREEWIQQADAGE